MAKTTPFQTFAAIFARWTQGATPEERATGERMADTWFKRRGKTRADIPAILAQAVKDDKAANPPPPTDPRDTEPAEPIGGGGASLAGLIRVLLWERIAM